MFTLALLPAVAAATAGAGVETTNGHGTHMGSGCCCCAELVLSTSLMPFSSSEEEEESEEEDDTLRGASTHVAERPVRVQRAHGLHESHSRRTSQPCAALKPCCVELLPAELASACHLTVVDRSAPWRRGRARTRP